MLWSPERETKESAERRAKLFLNRVFEKDRDDICTFTSISSFVADDRMSTFFRCLRYCAWWVDKCASARDRAGELSITDWGCVLKLNVTEKYKILY